ncbi:MAG: tetratricopeptide repeat protein [Deltaproteobacteria bacterium]|nr:tetratricopeptide repeat protein [Deltaproteobacteria bacterium]
MRTIVLVFSILVAVHATHVAHAKDADAQQAFLNGARLYEKGEYAKAVQWFRMAYEAQPNWLILYNIGQCEAEAKQYARAIDAFEQYLKEGGDAIKPEQQKELNAELLLLRSRLAYQQGTALFEQEKFTEAAAAFRKAHEMNPHWKVLYNIAQSEAAAGHHGLAMEAFEKYYALGAEKINLERQKAVEAELDRLQRLVGFVDIAAPDGAEIFVDDEKRGTAPLSGRLMVAAGVEHDLKIVHEQNELYRRKIKVSGRQSIAVAVQKDDVPKPEPRALPKVVAQNDIKKVVKKEPPKPSKPKVSTPHTASSIFVKWKKNMVPTGVAFMATGGGVVAASLIVGAVALKRSNDLDGPCKNDICPPDYHDKNDSVDNLSKASNVLLISGALVAASGAVQFFVGKKRREKDRLVNITPDVHGNGAGIVMDGRF